MTVARRRPYAELILALASSAVCALLLATGEWLVRRLDPAYLDRVAHTGIDTLHVYSEQLGWEPRPGARSVEKGKTTSINVHGYRGRVVAARKSAGTTRVVMLGDSVAFGVDVDDHETFAHLLDASDEFEVVNLAVQGYGTDQALLRLERDGWRHDPDVVVLNVCLDNDFVDNMLPVFLYDGVHPKPFFRLEQGHLRLHDDHVRLPLWQRLAFGLKERSHLYNRLLSLLHAQPERRTAHNWRALKQDALREADLGRALTLALVERMQADATRRGVRLLVLLHPDRMSYRKPSPWTQVFLATGRQRGLEVVDMREAYHAAGHRFWRVAMDPIGHLRPRGHRVAKDFIAAVLRDGA